MELKRYLINHLLISLHYFTLTIQVSLREKPKTISQPFVDQPSIFHFDYRQVSLEKLKSYLINHLVPVSLQCFTLTSFFHWKKVKISSHKPFLMSVFSILLRILLQFFLAGISLMPDKIFAINVFFSYTGQKSPGPELP